jgi:glycosyltransferase involved in cell wall biosynthesis
MKKKNILILTDHLYIGGAETVIYNLYQNLDRNLFNVSLCCIKEIGIIGKDLVKNGFEVLVINKSKLFKANYLSFWELKKIVREKKIDLVHTHTTQSLIDGALCKILIKNMKLVHTFHFGNYPHQRKKYLIIEKVLCKLADKLVSVGNEQKKIIIKIFKNTNKKNITTIWNGVKLGLKSKKDRIVFKFREENRVIIGSVCTLIEQKGLGYLLDVASILKNSNENVVFLIAGEGKLRTELEEKAKKLGLENYVYFLGWVKNASEVFIPYIDIFFLPSLWEAMSVVILEAMGCGKAVVATDVGESINIIENGVEGFLVKPKEINKMASVLKLLIHDKMLRDQCGLNARIKAEKYYGIERMCKEYEQIYNDVIGNNI